MLMRFDSFRPASEQDMIVFMSNSRVLQFAVMCCCVAACWIGLQTIQCADADEAGAGTGAAPAATTTAHPAGPLQGTVEDHDESLPPVEENFRVGTKFDDAKLIGLTPDNVWIHIPDWLGGKWHGETQTINYMYDYKSGMSSSMERVMKGVSDIVYGMQQSKDGQIWTFAKIPKLEKQETDFGYAYLYALREDLVSYSDAKLVIKFFYYEIRTDNRNKIMSVERVSSINNYTQLDDGLVRLKASLKSFDADGQPKLLQTSEKVLKQTAPYQEIDNYEGLDLKPLFAEFMKKIGKDI
jgi:hypothetical protein